MKYFNWRTRQTGDALPRSPYVWPIFAGILLIIALGFILRRQNSTRPSSLITSGGHEQPTVTVSRNILSRSSRPKGDKMPGTQIAEEIVAAKVVKFGQIRRDIVQPMAKRQKVAVPSDVERFFDAVASGKWEEIDAAHQALLLDPNQHNQPRSAE